MTSYYRHSHLRLTGGDVGSRRLRVKLAWLYTSGVLAHVTDGCIENLPTEDMRVELAAWSSLRLGRIPESLTTSGNSLTQPHLPQPSEGSNTMPSLRAKAGRCRGRRPQLDP